MQIATVLATAVAAVPHGALAQGRHGGPGADPAQLDVFLDQVAREWQQASEMNRRASNPEARSFLELGRSLLDQAREARRQGEVIRAAWLGEAAMMQIHRATQLMHLRDHQGTPQQAEQALREAEEMLNRLSRLGPAGQRARQVEKLVDQARKAGSDGHPQAALRFALMAQDQGRRAWQESMQVRMAAQRSRVLDVVVEPLVQRATRVAQERNDEQMMRVAGQAQEHLYMAKQMDAEAQPGPKARLLESAMREAELVLRTLDEAGYARHRSERIVADAQAAIDRAREVAGEQNDGDATDLVQRGENLLSQAQEKITSGDLDAAEALAEQARKMAQDAIRASLGPLDEGRVLDALGRTDRLIDGASSVTSETARQLLVSARQRQTEARQLLADGQLRRALAQTRIAARLAQRAYEADRKD